MDGDFLAIDGSLEITDEVEMTKRDQVDRILTSWAAKGETERMEASFIRDAILKDDPVTVMLVATLERQNKSMEELNRTVPKSMDDLRSELHRSINRSILVFGIISLVLMAGLVGSTIVLTPNKIEVNNHEKSDPE